MKVLITGGCGYTGHVLVPKLLATGHKVTVLDTQWFGNYLSDHEDLMVIKGDVRRINEWDLRGTDAVIHLASIANDPCGDLNPTLTWEVSALATMRLADRAHRDGVKHFIYASSGSVYGVKEEPDVTEDLELFPISEYNKTKMVSERVLMSYVDDMTVQIVRPATVCGFSPRMRLDVAVNLLTMAALTKGEITVLGGDQIRPNIHIEDISDVYLHFLNRPELAGTYNAGFENISILDIAKMVTDFVDADIVIEESNDPRSYRVNSQKLLDTGFAPKKTVRDAIMELVEHYGRGELVDEDRFHNLRWMKKKGFHNMQISDDL